MRALYLVPLALVACKETNPDFCPAHMSDPRCGGNGSADASVGRDGPDLDSAVTPDARAIFGTGNYTVHINTAPQPSVSFNPGSSFNTDTNPLCLSSQPVGWVQAGQPASCFVYAGTITVQDGLDVTGSRPLVFVASDALTIAGTLDVASKSTGKTGPGASFAGCGAFGATPASAGGAGGGGAGGSFMTIAGDGGTGASAAAAKGTAAAALTSHPTVLRGGCDGQAGAQGTANNPGAKGHGGGVVFLLAGSTITLNTNTIINASGGGGGVAQTASGGGGGGSGGMIVLYAPSINAGGKLVANGATGSTGASSTMGALGLDPDPNNPTTQGAGPTGSGGAGGVAYAGANDAGNGGNSGNGGGGGGGGAGYIQTNLALNGVTASPTPTLVP